MNRTLVLSLVAGLAGQVSGCSQVAAPEAEPLVSVASMQRLAGPNSSATTDLKSTRYTGTVVETADGHRFTDGDATLTVYYRSAASATLKLRVTAWDKSGEQWHGVFDLPESSLSDADTTLALGREPGQVSGNGVRIGGDGKRVFHGENAALTLKRGHTRGHHSSYQGRLESDTAQTSARFDVEYGLTCHVPPEMIGLHSRGTPTTLEGNPGLTLVQDNEFKSDFCKKFAALR